MSSGRPKTHPRVGRDCYVHHLRRWQVETVHDVDILVDCSDLQRRIGSFLFSDGAYPADHVVVSRKHEGTAGQAEEPVEERVVLFSRITALKVRQSGETVRLSVHLTDALCCEEIWSSSFKGMLGDSFDLQDRITEAIVGVLQPAILEAEVRRLQRQRPENLTAYSLVFQAMPKCWTLTKSACADAAAMLERAVDLDPDYALAHALLSWCHGPGGVYNWAERAELHRGNAWEIVRRAASLDSPEPLVLAILATAECTAGDIPAAAHVQRALEIDPNSSWG